MSQPNATPSPDPITMLVSYTPKTGKEDEFLALLEQHWPTLEHLGLVTEMRPRIWRTKDIRTNQIHFVEIFQWKNGEASNVAHQSPEVMAIWEPMEPLLDKMVLSEAAELAIGG